MQRKVEEPRDLYNSLYLTAMICKLSYKVLTALLFAGGGWWLRAFFLKLKLFSFYWSLKFILYCISST